MKEKQFKYFTNKGASLEASFVFKNFKVAMRFINELAEVAEELNHHPDWSNSYNKVHISLTTHDAGNQLTEKDYGLAERIERIIEKNDVDFSH